MTTGQTLGRLWRQYPKVREQLTGGELADEVRSDLERQAGQFKGRLVVNYSPLVKYVANRIGARMTGVVEQEDMIS